MFGDRTRFRITERPFYLFFVVRDSFVVRLNRCVNVVVGQVEQKRSIRIPLLQKADRFIGQPLREVFLLRLVFKMRIPER